jgi:DNA-binding MarR family transcriptional regulator
MWIVTVLWIVAMSTKITRAGTLGAAVDEPGTIVLLTRLAKSVHRHSSEELLGMRLRQYVLLSYLRDRAATPQQELAEMLWLDANNLVLLLNELESAGLATRQRDPGDRRRHVVDITAAGRRALARAERAQEGLEDDVLAALTPAERAALRRLLIAALERPPHS